MPAEARMVRVRQDVEVRPSCSAKPPAPLDNRDQALAYISEVAQIAAGYAAVPVLSTDAQVSVESQTGTVAIANSVT